MTHIDTCFKYAGTAELVGIVVGIFLCTVVFSFLLLVAGALVYRYLIHCTENSKHKFSEIKLLGLVPNFYSRVSARNLYFPTIGPQQTDRGDL
jgi:hypothetical protein